MPWHAANAIVCFTITVQRDIQIKIQGRMRFQRVVDNLVNASLNQPVGWNNQATHAVVTNEHVDDLRCVVTKSWLAARKPKVGYRRHRARNLFYLLESHVARTVQFLMIEAGATKTVAAGGDKQNHRAETLFA